MIRKRTVLILGAGASEPYGFPVGDDLYKQICDGAYSYPALQDDDPLRPIAERQRREFQDALLRSGHRSVDAFLERRTDLMDLGKQAIAGALIPYEREDTLFSPKTSRNQGWYRQLFAALNAPPRQFGNNALSVITFNYDRSLEHFLTTALATNYKIPPETALSELHNLPIIHLHGSLGEYRGGMRAYTSRVTHEEVREATSSIKIVHEAIDIDTDPQFVQARQVLSDAEKVIFLGFGYYSKNIERLRLDVIPKGVIPDSSAYGMTSPEQDEASRAVGRAIRFGHPNHGSLDFLRHQIILR